MKHNHLLCSLSVVSMIAFSCAAKSQQHTGMPQMKHEQTMHMTEPKQDESAPADTHAGHALVDTGKPGSWSYLGRDNPKPFTGNRWEMVPVPGYGHMYLNTGSLNRELICEALRDNPSVMVDRATRKECGMPELTTPGADRRIIVPEIPKKEEEAPHEHHPGMEMRHDDRMEMPEHWMAPEEAAKRPNPVPADPASIERGGKLYQTHCAVCHGPQGRGDGPAAAGPLPRPPDLAEMAGQHPDGDLAWKIANGRGPMPAWKGLLNETQIWDIVNFLSSL